MTIYLPLLAGILGTAAMTIFTAVSFRLLKKPFHVVRILANMMRFEPTTVTDKPPLVTYAMANLLHYGIGVGFAFGYHRLVAEGILGPNILYALLFGAFVGALGIIGWRIFFAVHPSPPAVSFKHYLPVIWLGHLLLAVVMFYMYRSFEEKPPAVSGTIPLCAQHSTGIPENARHKSILFSRQLIHLNQVQRV